MSQDATVNQSAPIIQPQPLAGYFCVTCNAPIPVEDLHNHWRSTGHVEYKCIYFQITD